MPSRRRRWIVLASLGVCVLVGAAWAGTTRLRQAQAAVDLPIAPARKGDFLVIIRCRGDVKAERSVALYAPIVPNLTIAWMAPAGEQVEAGKPVIRFDSSSAQQQLIQKQAALEQAQATLDQAAGQSRLTAEHDLADLANARYIVEKARLKTAGNAFLARIEAEEATIDLEVADQKLKVQEANIALHAAADRSKMASLTRLRDQAQADVNLTRRRIEQMEIRAPLTGFVAVASNYNQGPLSGRSYNIGDNVYSGMNLAEMPDLTSLVMDGKAEETDRGRIAVGNEVRVRVDALPELTIKATITGISPLAELGTEWPPTRSFRAYAALQHADSRLRPGMNGGMDVVIRRIPDAISIPAKAVFTRAGKPIVYVAQRGRYVPIEIQLLARNPDEIAVSGIPAQSTVALVDPEKKDGQRQR